MKQVKLLSKEISCMHCVMHIKQALQEIGISDAEVDLTTKTIIVQTENVEAVLKKLKEIGYPSEIM